MSGHNGTEIKSAGENTGGGEPDEHGALVNAVRLRLVESGDEPTPSRVAAALRAEGRLYGDASVLAVVRALRSDMVGAGPLEPLLALPDVTDVLVNGPDDVWIDRGRGLERADVRFADTATLRRLAQRMAMTAGRRLDDAHPWVDACLPDGTRIHAVLPPVVADSPCLSLRVVRTQAFTLEELVEARTLPREGAQLLRAIMDSRTSFMITGGTGSGKTTLLSSLLGLVDPRERIVLAEESAELHPRHPHVVRLEARPENQEGAGQVTLRDLVRQALRMRPDRLVVGEVRGAEVIDLLAALNTGHDGGCGTVHANAAADLPARLEALGSIAGLDRHGLHNQLAAALAVVVHMVRERNGQRRVDEVHVLERTATGLVTTLPAATIAADNGVIKQRGWPKLARMCRLGSTQSSQHTTQGADSLEVGPQTAIRPGTGTPCPDTRHPLPRCSTSTKASSSMFGERR